MQNKPNLLNAQMSANKVLTKDYENERLCRGFKNKANQTQFQKGYLTALRCATTAAIKHQAQDTRPQASFLAFSIKFVDKIIGLWLMPANNMPIRGHKGVNNI